MTLPRVCSRLIRSSNHFVSIQRDRLMEGLLEALEELQVKQAGMVRVVVHFEASCSEFRFEEREVVV